MRSRVEDFRSSSQKQSPRVGQETLLLDKIQISFQKPLEQKCEDVRKMIEEFPIEELNLFYPHLLGNIFGFISSKSWALHIPYSRNTEGLRRFLGPRGIVWNLVEKLERDTFLRYEFPVSCLPKPTRSSLLEGQIPPFYYNKVQFSGGNQAASMVNVGAMEYFLFHFSYFITQSSQIDGRWMEGSHETLYTVLLADYLEYFLPTNISLTRSENVSSSVYSKTEMKRHFTSPGEGYFRTSTPFTGLIKSFENKPSPYASSFDQSSSQLIQSETFLQILVEFWLNHIVNEDRNPFSPFVQDYFLPSIDHVRVVRVLVKHLHSFMNVNIHECEGVPPMELHKDFYRTFLPETFKMFKRNLFRFVHHCFVQWPLDTSFRFILETWLSYIQPWRYRNTGQFRNQKTSLLVYSLFWKPFVQNNLLFYTVIFLEFLNRAEKLNLRSSRDTQLFYRVTKVFSQKFLMPTVNSVEHELLTYLSSVQPHLRESPRSPKSAEYVHFMEFWTAGTNYRPLVMNETITTVHHLLRHIKNTLQSLREPQNGDSRSSQNIGWLKQRLKSTINWIQDVCSIDEHYWLILDENRKAEKNLELTYEQLRVIFQIPKEDTLGYVSEVDGNVSTIARISSQNDGDISPDCVETDKGIVLTALGKYQMANGLRRFTIQYSGDPDVQPVRSYEMVFLVRALYRLSTILNEKFGSTLTNIYYSPGLLSSFSRHLSPAVQTPRTLSPVKCDRPQTSDVPGQPKISLRYLASSRLWAQLLLFMFVFIFVLDRPWSAVFLTMFILLVMFLRHIHVVKRNNDRAKPEDKSLFT